MKLRSLLPVDLETVSALGIRSKASWGYGPGAMAVFAEELTLGGDDLDRFLGAEVAVDAAGQVLGYFTLVEPSPGRIELEHLFVDPEHFGRGIGTRLLGRALDLARCLGATEITLVSDPHATEFYRRLGAEITGHHPSSIPGRTIPILSMGVNSLGSD